LGIITPTQKIDDLVSTGFVAMGIIVGWIGFSPSTVSIKNDSNMVWGL
jgi:hypothetical protein